MISPELREEYLNFRPWSCQYCDSGLSARRDVDPAAFYESIGRPKRVVAPMVDQSELAFRMLCRRYGADLCYTPMFHSQQFCLSESYRSKHFTTCPEDRPLLAQFCGNDPSIVLEAAQYVEKDCDAIDLNLGCPQGIARKGHYGSFLMEDWYLIHRIIHTLREELSVPVTAKIRVFTDIDLTLAYVRMLVDAGISLLAVHGRTRDMKGGQTGIADWSIIRRIKEAFPEMPIIANGNILSYSDISRCIKATHCDGVMSAEGLLYDPRLFSPLAENLGLLNSRVFKKLPLTLALIDTVRALTLEYLDLAESFGAVFSHVKAHLFKLLYHLFAYDAALREKLNQAHEGHSMTEIRACIELICEASTAKCLAEGPFNETVELGREMNPESVRLAA